jgi:hypothetical protein
MQEKKNILDRATLPARRQRASANVSSVRPTLVLLNALLLLVSFQPGRVEL